MRAFVLINTKKGKIVPALDLLRRTQGVLSARAVAGTYDMIALVDGEDGCQEDLTSAWPGVSIVAFDEEFPPIWGLHLLLLPVFLRDVLV